MPTDPKLQAPRADPDRWKPLLTLIIPLCVIWPLGSLEYSYLAELFHGGSLRLLIPSLAFGLILTTCAFVLAVALLRWIRGPGIQPGIGELEAELAQLLAGGALVYRTSTRCLTVDPIHKTVRFENFQFITKFVSNPVRPVEEVAFAEILGTLSMAGRGPPSLTIRTIKGQVEFSSDCDWFDELQEILDAIIAVNRAHPEQYQEKLNAEPVVKTMWYGWVILLAAMGAVGYLGWKYLYQD